MDRPELSSRRSGARLPLLALMALLIAGLVAPAVATMSNTADATFVTAPASVGQGGALGDVMIDVAGSISVDVADLPQTAALGTPTATLALLDAEGAVVPGALIGEDVATPADLDVDLVAGTATFSGVFLDAAVALGDDYELQATVELDGAFSTSATNPLVVTEPNDPPEAAFSADCDGLACTFTDASSDPDGTIASRAWAFGDPADSTATVAIPTFTYPAAGSYDVTLTVTDDDGATDTATASLEVFDASQSCTDGCTFSFVSERVDYTISGPVREGATAGVNLDTSNAAFEDACADLEIAHPEVRVLPTTYQVVPSGFAAGDLFTVTIVIPKTIINEDVNRSDKPWTVCFLDEAPDDGSAGDGFKGETRLLDPCELTADRACLVSREKFQGGKVKMVFEFPAVDPYFR